MDTARAQLSWRCAGARVQPKKPQSLARLIHLPLSRDGPSQHCSPHASELSVRLQPVTWYCATAAASRKLHPQDKHPCRQPAPHPHLAGLSWVFLGPENACAVRLQGCVWWWLTPTARVSEPVPSFTAVVIIEVGWKGPPGVTSSPTSCPRQDCPYPTHPTPVPSSVLCAITVTPNTTRHTRRTTAANVLLSRSCMQWVDPLSSPVPRAVWATLLPRGPTAK